MKTRFSYFKVYHMCIGDYYGLRKHNVFTCYEPVKIQPFIVIYEYNEFNYFLKLLHKLFTM